jgi:hypothetical protein
LARNEWWIVVAALISVERPILAGSQPVFEDISARLRPQFQHQQSPTCNKYLIETMGGGVALLDYDNDGRLDIFFTNGARLLDPMPPAARPDKSDPKFWNRLYHQNAGGTFDDVTEAAGLSGNPESGYSMGVAVADFDNDGFQDLFVTGFSGSILYRNTGKGKFEDVTEKAGVRATGWTVSAGFFDYDKDGRLDLFVTRYLDWNFQNNRFCGDRVPGYRAYCHPENFAPVSNILYRNNGDGTFIDVSKAAGIADHKGKALGVAFADYDNDGWMDIFVANDSIQCFLFHNNGDGTFTENALTSGAGLNQDGRAFAGMGADFADYDNDGLPDIVVTDLSKERYVLFRNLAGGFFSDESSASGLAATTMPFSGWGVRFFDYDNDGWKDLFVAQGHVLDNVQMSAANLTYEQPPLLVRNERGKLERVKVSSAFDTPRAGRGAAFGDIDNDGAVDIVVSNLGQSPSIFRNRAGGSNHWLGIRLQGNRSNRDGIGARIELLSGTDLQQTYIVSTSSSYLSASDHRVIAGLGSSPVARSVTIRWPSGIIQKLTKVKGDRVLTVIEPHQ